MLCNVLNLKLNVVIQSRRVDFIKILVNNYLFAFGHIDVYISLGVSGGHQQLLRMPLHLIVGYYFNCSMASGMDNPNHLCFFTGA